MAWIDIIIEAIIWLIVLFIISAVIAVGSTVHVDFSPSQNGLLSDTVFSVEKSGLLWKRWEIWFTNDHTTKYCTRDDNIAKILTEAQTLNKKVSVNFNDEFFVWDWDCSSNTVIKNAVIFN